MIMLKNQCAHVNMVVDSFGHGTKLLLLNEKPFTIESIDLRMYLILVSFRL